MTHTEKEKLRTACRKAGETLSEPQKQRLSQIITGRIERMPQFADARTVAAYYALPDEVSTLPLLNRWIGTKTLALPAIENGRMVFREYTGESDIAKGAFGIGQPRGGRIVRPDEIDLMLVPGTAFDLRGRRLGRGKGFYDSYLSLPDAAKIYKIGVCFPHMLVGEVPCEPHDTAVDEVVSCPAEN